MGAAEATPSPRLEARLSSLIALSWGLRRLWLFCLYKPRAPGGLLLREGRAPEVGWSLLVALAAFCTFLGGWGAPTRRCLGPWLCALGGGGIGTPSPGFSLIEPLSLGPMATVPVLASFSCLCVSSPTPKADPGTWVRSSLCGPSRCLGAQEPGTLSKRGSLETGNVLKQKLSLRPRAFCQLPLASSLRPWE